MEVLFWPLFCHLNSYNANGARVTSGGIPALCVCVCVYVKKCVWVSKTECLCPFYSLQTRYSTEPRITMLLLWKTKNNNKKKSLQNTHTHTHTLAALWWVVADRWRNCSQLVPTNWTTDQCFCCSCLLCLFSVSCFLQMSHFTCLPSFLAELSDKIFPFCRVCVCVKTTC